MASRSFTCIARNFDYFLVTNKVCLYRTSPKLCQIDNRSPTSHLNRDPNVQLGHYRWYCAKAPKDGHNQPGPARTWKYILDRFTDRLDKYLLKLSKKSPLFLKVVDVVRLVKCLKFVVQDTRTYYSVLIDVKMGRELETFSRKELELYYQMPKDILKLAPFVTIALIPIVGNIIYIFGYLFPRHFLTHQFWTAEQKEKYFQLAHKKKISEYRHILTYLDKQVNKHMTGEAREKMLNILKKVETGQEPSIEELLEVREYFSTFPLCVDSLPTPYFRHLVKSCDMSTRRFPLLMYGAFYFKQRRTPFQEDGYLLLHTDQVMVKEGLDSLTNEEICKACLRRGLNPYGLSKEEQLSYLQKWIGISTQLDESSISLLLHSQVLLTYNCPTNINLMKGSKYSWKRKT